MKSTPQSETPVIRLRSYSFGFSRLFTVHGSELKPVRKRPDQPESPTVGFYEWVGKLPMMRKNLVALYVHEGSLFFRMNNEAIRADYSGVRARIRTRRWFRRTFEMVNESGAILEFKYFSLSQPSTEKLDGPFLEEVVHWLKSTEQKRAFRDLWS